MKTKYFRVARSGKTIDGREITPAQIDEMAETYNPATYGARIFMEHMRSLLPDGPFAALGDVLAVQSTTDPDGAKVLLAQVDATPQLVKLSQDRQKVYWSIELAPNMAGSGKAYLAGLSVTDSPASLGTEMLRFSMSQASEKIPAHMRDHLFSEPVEATMEPQPEPDSAPGVLARVREALTGQNRKDGERFAALEKATVEIATELASIRSAIVGFNAQAPTTLDDLPTNPPADPPIDPIAALAADMASLREAFSKIPAAPGRFLASGTPATTTDC